MVAREYGLPPNAQEAAEGAFFLSQLTASIDAGGGLLFALWMAHVDPEWFAQFAWANSPSLTDDVRRQIEDIISEAKP